VLYHGKSVFKSQFAEKFERSVVSPHQDCNGCSYRTNSGSKRNSFNGIAQRKFENEEVKDLFEFLTNFKNGYLTSILFDMMLKIKAIIVLKQASMNNLLESMLITHS
jgi:hypothetical protein